MNDGTHDSWFKLRDYLAAALERVREKDDDPDPDEEYMFNRIFSYAVAWCRKNSKSKLRGKYSRRCLINVCGTMVEYFTHSFGGNCDYHPFSKAGGSYLIGYIAGGECFTELVKRTNSFVKRDKRRLSQEWAVDYYRVDVTGRMIKRPVILEKNSAPKKNYGDAVYEAETKAKFFRMTFCVIELSSGEFAAVPGTQSGSFYIARVPELTPP